MEIERAGPDNMRRLAAALTWPHIYTNHHVVLQKQKGLKKRRSKEHQRSQKGFALVYIKPTNTKKKHLGTESRLLLHALLQAELFSLWKGRFLSFSLLFSCLALACALPFLSLSCVRSLCLSLTHLHTPGIFLLSVLVTHSLTYSHTCVFYLCVCMSHSVSPFFHFLTFLSHTQCCI